MEDVTIRDVDIPFKRLVFVMVKLMIASIPAAVIFFLIMSVVMGLVAAIGGSMLENLF